MSREIKFRIYNLIENKLLYCTYSSNDVLLTLNGKPITKDYLNYSDGDYILQEFTGLYDKNNNEIYENDLIQMFEEGEIYEVIWRNAAFILQEINTKNKREWLGNQHRKIVGNTKWNR